MVATYATARAWRLARESACALAPDDIETRHHQPCVASCGTPFLLTELKERRGLAAARGRAEVLAENMPRETTGVLLYERAGDAEADIRGGEHHDFADSHAVSEPALEGRLRYYVLGCYNEWKKLHSSNVYLHERERRAGRCA